MRCICRLSRHAAHVPGCSVFHAFEQRYLIGINDGQVSDGRVFAKINSEAEAKIFSPIPHVQLTATPVASAIVSGVHPFVSFVPTVDDLLYQTLIFLFNALAMRTTLNIAFP
jgi:hypothetical protein